MARHSEIYDYMVKITGLNSTIVRKTIIHVLAAVTIYMLAFVFINKVGVGVVWNGLEDIAESFWRMPFPLMVVVIIIDLVLFFTILYGIIHISILIWERGPTALAAVATLTVGLTRAAAYDLADAWSTSPVVIHLLGGIVVVIFAGLTVASAYGSVKRKEIKIGQMIIILIIEVFLITAMAEFIDQIRM